MFFEDIPVTSAHSEAVLLTPLYLMNTVDLRLFACCFSVAQRTLSGS